MKIDSHQHFWKYNEKEFGWISNEMSVIRKDFLPSDLKVEMDKAGFDGSIAVQARQKIEETKWLLDLSSEYHFIRGVVGWVDLCSHELTDQLEQFSQNSKFVGVRHVIHDESDDNFMLRPDFINGIKQLEQYNLTYDILIFPKHLPNTLSLVKQFPDQIFIVDHIGKPDIKNQNLDFWKENIKKLALYPNVFCKLSGMVTEANWKSWKPEDFKPFLDVVFQSFGTERLLIGSDWPVCTVAGSYGVVMDIVRNYIEKLSLAEQKAVLGSNAIRIYNILPI